MERTNWPDPRLDRLEARINGMPEMVATHTVEIVELRDDVRAIRKLLENESRAREKATESIRQLIESQTGARETNRTLKVVAFATAGLALLGSISASVVQLVTQV